MRARARAFGRPALSVAAGVAVWTSFPPLSLWWMAAVGIAAWLVALDRQAARVAAVCGFAFGLGLLLPMMSFLRGLGVDAWLVVAVLESLWFAALGALVSVTSRRRWWLAATPFVWVAVEWVRDRWPFGGFPWGRIAFGQADGPLLPLAAWGGAPLIAVAVVALGAALAWAATRVRAAVVGRAGARAVGSAAVAGLGAVAAACVALGSAALVDVPTAGTTRGGPAHAVVAAVQGNVPRLGLDAFAQRRAVTVDHARETQALAERVAGGAVARPALVIWPENASDQDPYRDPVARDLIDASVQAVGVPIVVGAVIDGPDARHVQNAAIVWSPQTGPGQRYVKRHLVPFGEYLPMRSLLTKLVSRFALIAKDFAPGHRPGVLTAGGIRFADVICFEVADDGVVRDAVNAGGRLLVVQTNNASYESPGDSGRGGETAQQLQMSRLRAVEHGRAVIVAATSGVSAVIAPDGRVVQRTGVFVPATLVADVALRDPRTLADRLGAWPERVFAAVGAVAVALTWWPRRRRRVDATSAPEPQPAPAMAGTP